MTLPLSIVWKVNDPPYMHSLKTDDPPYILPPPPPPAEIYEQSLSDGDANYNDNPASKDKDHSVVFVIDGSNFCVLSQIVLDKLIGVRGLVREWGVSIDGSCPKEGVHAEHLIVSNWVYSVSQQGRPTCNNIQVSFLCKLCTYFNRDSINDPNH